MLLPSEDVVLDKLILAIRGAPFQLFTTVHEDTIVEIRDKSYPSLIEVVFRSFANRVGRHWDGMPILHEDFCILVETRSDYQYPEEMES